MQRLARVFQWSSREMTVSQSSQRREVSKNRRGRTERVSPATQQNITGMPFGAHLRSQALPVGKWIKTVQPLAAWLMRYLQSSHKTPPNGQEMSNKYSYTSKNKENIYPWFYQLWFRCLGYTVYWGGREAVSVVGTEAPQTGQCNMHFSRLPNKEALREFKQGSNMDRALLSKD